MSDWPDTNVTTPVVLYVPGTSVAEHVADVFFETIVWSSLNCDSNTFGPTCISYIMTHTIYMTHTCFFLNI